MQRQLPLETPTVKVYVLRHKRVIRSTTSRSASMALALKPKEEEVYTKVTEILHTLRID